MKKYLILGMLAGVLQANAQYTGSATDSDTTTEATSDVYGGMSATAPTSTVRSQPTGLAGFIEVSSGYTNNINDLPVEGAPNEIKLLGSYYTESQRGVFDAGVGTHTQSFIDDGALEENTTTTTMELAARYQFENRWQVGAVYNQLFDRGPNYFSNQADAMFGGVQLLKEFNLGTDTHMRIGVRAMRDINTEDEDVDMAMLDLAIGYDPQ